MNRAGGVGRLFYCRTWWLNPRYVCPQIYAEDGVVEPERVRWTID